jgi:hypothetical protein
MDALENVPEPSQPVVDDLLSGIHHMYEKENPEQQAGKGRAPVPRALAAN